MKVQKGCTPTPFWGCWGGQQVATAPSSPGSALLAFCFCALSFLGLGMLRRSLKLPLLALPPLSCKSWG